MTGMCLALYKSNDYSEYNWRRKTWKFIPKKIVHNMMVTYVNSF